MNVPERQHVSLSVQLQMVWLEVVKSQMMLADLGREGQLTHHEFLGRNRLQYHVMMFDAMM